MAVTEERRIYLREKKREQRAKARQAGLCLVCAKFPADANMATCAQCRENITEISRANGWYR